MKTCIAAIIAIVAAGGVQAQSPDAVMDRAVKAYSEMSSVRAEFRQTITNPLTGTTSTSRGVMLRKAPNLLSINFTDPRGDRLVADGKSVWVYLPSSAPGQVLRMPASGNNSLAMVDPAGVFLSSPSSRYTMSTGGTATISGRKANIVLLVPRKSNNAFSRAKVWVDVTDDTIRQFEVVDANGLTRMVTITKLQPNAPIGRGEFSFTPPKNARVLDSSALSGM
ncbi:MAG: outer membrane lipoprotein chaperone LolA [Gemmatimonadaceae bacterium]|nr:outer membrane lipoprotein chaperone LolA [Gemmatimonadaceae bacterium]